MGYIYKIWKITDLDFEGNEVEKKICIRCSVHSHVAGQKNEDGEPAYMNVYSLNEFNPNLTDWKNNLDQLIPCLNREIANNSFKITRWLVQSLLADVEFIKFAFISRKDTGKNDKHQVLATHTV